MQFATPFLLTVLSLAGLGASQVADGFDGLVPREAGPLASAYAETLAEAHPHDVEEIQGIYARAAAGAKKQVCKRELSPRCFGSRDGHLVCNPPNGRITLPPAVQHGNPIPIDCLQIATCVRMNVAWRGHAANAVPRPALNACRQHCHCDP